MKTAVYRIPEWSLPYLINGDIESCSDYEINEMNRWLETNHIDIVGPHGYTSKLGENLQEAAATQYNMTNLVIHYI